MKMFCPHCGVKGSAPGSLVGTRLKCPKCRGIFVVEAEVAQPIVLSSNELEQLQGWSSGDLGSVADNIDDILDKILDDTNDTIIDTTVDSEKIAAPSLIEGESGDVGEPPAVIKESPVEAQHNDIAQLFEDEEFQRALKELGQLQEQAEREEKKPVAGEIDIDDIFDLGNETAQSTAHAPKPTEEAIAEVDIFASPVEVGEDAKRLEQSVGGEEYDAGTELAKTDDKQTFADNHRTVIQKCVACHEYADPNAYYTHDNNIYCTRCLPPCAVLHQGNSTQKRPKTTVQEQWNNDVDQLEETTKSHAEETADDNEMFAAARTVQSETQDAKIAARPSEDFTISTLIKDTFHYSQGAKGSLWGAIVVMSLILGGVWAGGIYLLDNFSVVGNFTSASMVKVGFQMVLDFLFFVFSAGILMIGIRCLAQDPFSWKLLFTGFKHLGSVLLLYILMSSMLLIGFMLFILPGIYLSVGYILALPLLLDKKLSPWQALERSRMALHTRWWTVFFAMIALSILIVISAIPFGIGLIWTIPMSAILIAVLYYRHFGTEQ